MMKRETDDEPKQQRTAPAESHHDEAQCYTNYSSGKINPEASSCSLRDTFVFTVVLYDEHTAEQ